MSRWSGRYYKGAKRDDKAAKRREAESRNDRTPFVRRRRYRRETGGAS